MSTQLSGSIVLSGSITATDICPITASWAVNSSVIANTGSFDSQIIIIPKTNLYNDANNDVPAGSTNLTRTGLLQGIIDSASAVYTQTGQRATLVFPSGSINVNEIVLMPNVVYSAIGTVIVNKAENSTSSQAYASLVRTRRMNVDGLPNSYGLLTKYINASIVAGSGDQAYFTASYTGALYRADSTQALPIGSITRRDKCINAVLSFTQSYANPDNVYGASDNITFAGPGKFIFKVGTASVSAPIMALREVRDFLVHPGVVEVHHNQSTASASSQWAIRIGGRNITWYDPIVRYGFGTGQDGFHISHGKHIRVQGGYLETGDDSIALGSLNNGPSNVDPDEAIEDVSIVNTTCITERARAIVLYVGKNDMSVPYTPISGSGYIRRIQATNLNGWASKTNDQSAVRVFYDSDIGRIYQYRILSSGSGYPINDDFVCNVVPSGSGGSGAQAVVRVESGSITYVWPRYMNNVNGSGSTTWAFGNAGYVRDATVDLSPLGTTGSTVTGSVLAVRSVYSNSTIEDVYVSGKFLLGSDNLDWSGSTGNGTNPSGPVSSAKPFGLSIDCGRRMSFDLGITFNEGKNAALGGFRVLDVSAGEDIKIQMNMNNACSRAGTIRNADSSSITDRISVVNSNFIGTTNHFSVLKFDGQVGDVYFLNNTCKEIRDSKAFLDCSNNETKPTTVAQLTMRDCTFISSGSSGTGRWMTLSTSSAVSSPCITTFIATGNDILQAQGSVNAKASFKDKLSFITNWTIRDNPGFSTYVRKIITIPSGSTRSTPITASTETGIPSSSMSSSATCISITPIDNNTTATAYWRTYDPTSASYSISTNGTASAGGYNFTVVEDTSIK
jgi:hypothetical protein